MPIGYGTRSQRTRRLPRRRARRRQPRRQDRSRVPLRTFRPRGPSNSRTCCTRTPNDVLTTRSAAGSSLFAGLPVPSL
ncbi:hypothetical protein PBI_LEMURIA_62 [Mycobacterium phage Lemuria]|uniref:Uncharacterized protein n=1 Tax=Mycobacterium phage Lemuria TaxID=2599868 RepID=A0A5J6TJB1_9CAUD|nr:hypothetical protein KDW76_gp62 [Mycobacterium phage Lemuria]QFG10144.1 hypothetical protein PBI_LEMURIA_62 [Mycobacterium phage Lemuria]